MRLTIAKADLARVLTNVGRVVETRTTIPILSSVMLSATETGLTVTGTDLDIVATDRAPADVSEAGTVCVEAKLLSDIAKKVAGEVTMSLEGDKLVVKSGRSRFSLGTLPADDFPTLDGGKYDAEFEVDLAALFAPVAFAISMEAARYYLNGVFIHHLDGNIVAVATDGHRLSRHVGPVVPEFPSVIVPRKTVGVLPKGTVTLSVSETKVQVVAGDFVLTSKLIDGTFPDYQRVIPTSNDKKIVFGSDDMRQAAGRVSVVSSERGRAVKMSFADGRAALAVSSADHGIASDEINVNYGGEPIEIGFNAAYLRDLFGVLPSGPVTMALADSGSPGLFTSPAFDGLTLVLMPMRV